MANGTNGNWDLWTLRLGFVAVSAGWMGLIFYLSSLSGAEVSRPLNWGWIQWLGELRPYLAHIVLYAVLAALVQAAIWGWDLGFRLRWVIVAAVFSSLYGISDEYHQSFVIGRSATVVDCLVDSVAATTSATMLWALVTTYRTFKKKNLSTLQDSTG